MQSLPLTPRGGDEYEATLELGCARGGTGRSSDRGHGLIPGRQHRRVLRGEYRIPVRRGWSWDFEDPVSALQLDGDWEIGAPVEAGFNYSGQQALATKLNDRYTDDLTSYVTWGPIDLSTFDRASSRFRTWCRPSWPMTAPTSR
ncbi:MAG: hypothetical protein R3E12_13545 [Candidatus Eisenbacteria bacterium]